MIGSEWKRWDLHIHTPETVKNDKFDGKTSNEKWSKYYECISNYIDPTDPKKDIVVLGITDYLSVDNYKKVLKDNELPESIKLILPNVEFRLSLKGGKSPVNIHCIFNPDFLDDIESRFFTELKVDNGERNYCATRDQLISLGKSLDTSIRDDRAAYKKGIENFVVDLQTLSTVLKNKDIRDNVIVVVANKETDGASGLKGSQFEMMRNSVYKISDAIFSANPKDIKYFVGEGADSFEILKEKICGIKPCFHGSDAHCNSRIFEPEHKRYCYIKAEPTFEGLKQTLTDPKDRVFIGEIPSVVERIRQTPEMIINALEIQKVGSHQGWFSNSTIHFNPQLNVIIGNKGSGKTAIADILGLCSNSERYSDFLFLKTFKEATAATQTKARIKYLNDVSTSEITLSDMPDDKTPTIKYLPQAYFEGITNEIQKIEGFRSEIENVIFQYLPEIERQEARNFTEYRKIILDAEKDEIQQIKVEIKEINSEIIELEDRCTDKRVKTLEADLVEKNEIVEKHKENEPQLLAIDTKDEDILTKKRLGKLEGRLDRLNQFKSEINNELARCSTNKRKIQEFRKGLELRIESIESYLYDNKLILDEVDLLSSEIFSYNYSPLLLDEVFKDLEVKIDRYNNYLSEPVRQTEKVRGNSLQGKIEVIQNEVEKIISTESLAVQEAKRRKEEHLQWQKKLIELVGEGDNPEIGTLLYLEKELAYIKKGLKSDLKSLEVNRGNLSKKIMSKKREILLSFQKTTENLQKVLNENKENSITIVNSFVLNPNFEDLFLEQINRQRVSSFRGNIEGKEHLRVILKDHQNNDPTFDNIETLLENLIKELRVITREGKEISVDLSSFIKDRQALYDYLFGLDYLKTEFDLRFGEKMLDQLSPGERGAVLLIFYLLLDQEKIPLLIDQPEDNLDNQSVADILVPYIKQAKMRRQIIMVTHNPNLAVVSDAELVIGVSLDKKNNNQFSFVSGGIENEKVNEKIQNILEGTARAFRIRDSKYFII